MNSPSLRRGRLCAGHRECERRVLCRDSRERPDADSVDAEVGRQSERGRPARRRHAADVRGGRRLGRRHEAPSGERRRSEPGEQQRRNRVDLGGRRSRKSPAVARTRRERQSCLSEAAGQRCYVAARSDGSAAVVQVLIEAGADPKAADSLKTTVLHAAVLGNDIETIRVLIDAGADVNAADLAGFTPLMISRRARQSRGRQTAARERRERQCWFRATVAFRK